MIFLRIDLQQKKYGLQVQSSFIGTLFSNIYFPYLKHVDVPFNASSSLISFLSSSSSKNKKKKNTMNPVIRFYMPYSSCKNVKGKKIIGMNFLESLSTSF